MTDYQLDGWAQIALKDYRSTLIAKLIIKLIKEVQWCKIDCDIIAKSIPHRHDYC